MKAIRIGFAVLVATLSARATSPHLWSDADGSALRPDLLVSVELLQLESPALAQHQSDIIGLGMPFRHSHGMSENEADTNLKINGLIVEIQKAIQSREYDKAEEKLKVIISLDPKNWEAYWALSTCQYNLQDYDHAVDSVQKSMAFASESLEHPRIDRAVTVGDMGVMSARAGDLYRKLDQAAKATDAYQKAAVSLEQGVELLQRKGERRNATELKADLTILLTWEGDVGLRLKDEVKANAAFQRVVQMSPDSATGYYDLCVSLFNSEDMEAAADACSKSIALDPGRADAHFAKGLALYNSVKENKGSYVFPPGTSEELNKYIQLAPQGAHVQAAKRMLEAVDAAKGSNPETH